MEYRHAPLGLLTLLLPLLLVGCGAAPEGDAGPRSDAGVRSDGGLDAGSAGVCGDGVCAPAEVCTADCGCECDIDFECSAGCACDPECGACEVASCQDGVASSCDGTLTLFCGDIGAACAGFTSETGQPFQWCSCGALGEGEGRCLGTTDAVVCDVGIPLLANCPLGTRCDDGGGTVGCTCDDLNDGVCPDPGCMEDPDCATCTPACGGAECGDNGCGGSCGECGIGLRCSAGRCEASCTPDCGGRACGTDGCGGTCGTCAGDEVCDDDGQCRSECTPRCAPENLCGPDGCGGRCGPACSGGEFCRNGGDDGWACACDERFSPLEYTIDAGEVTYLGDGDARVTAVVVLLQHIDEDGAGGRTRSYAFEDDTPATVTHRDTGCAPRVRVTRRYYGLLPEEDCTLEETVTGQLRIAIPPVRFAGPGTCEGV
ncbi:MAG: hypothetical protein AB8I08_00510 [Sandaracinaceae bacterium]